MAFESSRHENRPESLSKVERMDSLAGSFVEAETAIPAGERERSKSFLPNIYGEILSLNRRVAGEVAIWVWNPEGDLTEEEFNTLNHRRKLLSNAIGIMTKSGEIRHDLNEV